MSPRRAANGHRSPCAPISLRAVRASISPAIITAPRHRATRRATGRARDPRLPRPPARASCSPPPRQVGRARRRSSCASERAGLVAPRPPAPPAGAGKGARQQLGMTFRNGTGIPGPSQGRRSGQDAGIARRRDHREGLGRSRGGPGNRAWRAVTRSAARARPSRSLARGAGSKTAARSPRATTRPPKPVWASWHSPPCSWLRRSQWQEHEARATSCWHETSCCICQVSKARPSVRPDAGLAEGAT